MEERISELLDRTVGSIQFEKSINKQKERKVEERLRNLRDIKWSKIHIIVPEGEEKEKALFESLFKEILAEKFSDMEKETNI